MSRPDQPAKDRYPGLCSFETDEHRIFFGRSRETAELLQMVRSEQLVVLFSKSGLGKSSLLSAGLFPRLTPFSLLPIRVRFQAENRDSAGEPAPGELPTDGPPANVPLTVLLNTLTEHWQAAYQRAGLPQPAVTIPYDAASPKLWEQVRARPFPNGITPVLMFDQFEEFFAYSPTDQQGFASQLAELMHDQAPARVINWLLDLPAADRTPALIAWSRQPPVKAVVAIRSDRLAELHSLKPYIGLILRNRYELGPLREEAARDAIQLPADLPQSVGPFATPCFTYDPAVRELILRTLSNDNCEIEGSQLQIVCQHVEHCMKDRFRADASAESRFRAVVDTSIISGEKEINRILDKFYRTQLSTIGDAADREIASHVIENELVEGGRRVGLSKGKMLRLLGNFPEAHKEALIRKLQLARLIRSETTHLGEMYELSHDALIEPVEKVRDLRLAHQNRRAAHDESVRRARELREQAGRLEAETSAKEAAIRQEREKDAQLRQIGQLQTERAIILRRYKWLAYFLAAAVLAIIGLAYLQISQTENQGFINAMATAQYERGDYPVAFRMWDQIDSTRHHAFAPYIGRDVRADTNRHYVAVRYGRETLDVRQQQPGKPDLIVYHTQAVAFKLAGASLVVYRKDTASCYTIEIINLATKKSLIDSIDVFNFQDVTLSDDGQYAVINDQNNQPDLFVLAGRPGGKVAGFSRTLAPANASKSLITSTFSPRKTYLLLTTDAGSLWVYDLRRQRMAQSLTGVAGYAVSASDQLAIVTAEKQTLLFDLNRGTQRLIGPQLAASGTVNQVAFSPDQSAVLIVTTPVGRDAGYQLHVLHPDKNQRTFFATNVADYWLFSSVGQLVYTTRKRPNRTMRYTLKNQRSVTLLRDSFPAVAIGHSHVLLRRGGSKTAILAVESGIFTDGPALKMAPDSTFTTQVTFYAPDGRADTHLIALYTDSVRVFDLRTNQKTLIRRQGPPFSNLSLTGNLIRVQLGEEDARPSSAVSAEYWCYFIDNRKNEPDYLRHYVYPLLTKAQRDQFSFPR